MEDEKTRNVPLAHWTAWKASQQDEESRILIFVDNMVQVGIQEHTGVPDHL